jgi:hypothetical protein
MKPLYHHEHEGLFFSKNGHLAYLRGEKPAHLLPYVATLEPTTYHHIEIPHGPRCRLRRLVMFYRKIRL